MKNHTPPHDDSSASTDVDLVESVKSQQSKEHKPVLLKEVIKLLEPKQGESYLDLTAGYGGHATSVVEMTKAPKQATLVDRDVFAFETLREVPQLKGATHVHNTFKNACTDLKLSHRTFDMILLDLGVSSPQLDNADRGFSFKKHGSLDMRMDQSQPLSAKDVVNDYKLSQLSKILKQYGDIGNSDTIAQLIISHRPLGTTTDLVSALMSINPRNPTKMMSTVFQAIRIEVNQEIIEIEQALKILPQLLNPGGRLAIISFHSLEDRAVKVSFRSLTSEGLLNEYKLLTKAAIQGKIKDVTNPRSRSAMLRAVAKLK